MYTKEEQESGRERQKKKIKNLDLMGLFCRMMVSACKHTYLHECLSEKGYLSCLSQCIYFYKFTDCKRTEDDGICVCVSTCVVCVFVGGLRDRQTVKDEPGYARPVPTDFKFSRHFVYIGRLF